MGQLDHDGGVEDLGTGGVAEVRGQQRQHRAHPLAAGLDQVPRHGVGQLVAVRDGLAQPELDLVETLRDGVGHRRPLLSTGHHCPVGQGAAAVMAPARSRNGCGKTPSTRVATTPMPTAVPVSQPPATTVGRSVDGSVKYISTTTRR